MNMDKRQRAMLREMGVRVWQPTQEPAEKQTPALPATPVGSASPISRDIEPQIAIASEATRARNDLPAAPFIVPLTAPRLPRQTAPPATRAEDATSNSAWRAGAMQTLYADTSGQDASRWLILLEAPASSQSGSFNPLDGDAGKLLDNMLRAARLHLAGAVLLAPLVRSGTGSDLPDAVATVLASAQADVVLVMGRLAAQALLQSTAPLAKLRGHVHPVQGQQIVITIDPAYLLRNPLDKAKAWDDLCLALSVISVAGRVPTQ